MSTRVEVVNRGFLPSPTDSTKKRYSGESPLASLAYVHLDKEKKNGAFISLVAGQICGKSLQMVCITSWKFLSLSERILKASVWQITYIYIYT
jgi:hypothetical protein